MIFQNILVSYRGIPESPGWANGDLVVRAFNELGYNAVPYGRYYKTGVPLGRVPYKIDLAVIMECNDSDPQYFELAQLNCPKVYWEFDTTMHLDFTKRWISFMQFGKVFFGNLNVVKDNPGSIYLPFAGDTKHFKPCDSKKEGAAIIGTPFKERAKFAEVAQINILSGIYRDDYAKSISKLKVHVHHYASGGNGLIVMRPWETLSSKTCLLTEEDPTLLEHFVPGFHLVTYKDAKDCRKKLDWLLTHDKEREQIAQNGYDLIMKKHTYTHRVQELLNYL